MPRAPRHWNRPPGLTAALLAPLGWLYGIGTARRIAKGPRERLGIPIICVGNLTAGGTGKTPTVMALADRLSDHGAQILSRGYGGALTGPVQVDAARHSAADVGDEPLLLSAFAPVWVAKDRHAGALAARDAGAKVLILDDGFQDARLAYDLSIVVVDAGRGFGNGRIIPAGPLREPVMRGLARADAILSIGSEAAQSRFAERYRAALPIPHLTGSLDTLPTGLPLSGAPVVAVAGIGDPEKFFATVRGTGAKIVQSIALADHQELSRPLMTRLLRDATEAGAILLTTEKDAVRLPREFRASVTTLPVRLSFDDPAKLQTLLARLL
ncbi:MAG: tetraacyldisaccharide 4'-kinase [Pseudomonadota bacterium]